MIKRRKDIELRCEYCRFGCVIGEGEIACLKRGIITPGYRCAKFKYDPAKRIPDKRSRVDSSRFSAEDFEI